MRRMAEAGRPDGMLLQLLVRCIPVPLLHWPESPEADDFRGSLLRNCFHIFHKTLMGRQTNTMATVNLATNTPTLAPGTEQEPGLLAKRYLSIALRLNRRQDCSVDFWHRRAQPGKMQLKTLVETNRRKPAATRKPTRVEQTRLETLSSKKKRRGNGSRQSGARATISPPDGWVSLGSEAPSHALPGSRQRAAETGGAGDGS